jgi:hypothetical protein
MARAVNSFYGQQTTGMIGKNSYTLNRCGQVVGARARASNPRSQKQNVAREIFKAALYYWWRLESWKRAEWYAAYPKGNDAYIAFTAAARRNMRKLLDDGSTLDHLDPLAIGPDASDQVNFPINSIFAQQDEGNPAEFLLLVAFQGGNLGIANIALAHAIVSQSTFQERKLKHLVYATGDYAAMMPSAPGASGASWVRIECCSARELKPLKTYDFKMAPGLFVDISG